MSSKGSDTLLIFVLKSFFKVQTEYVARPVKINHVGT